MVKIVFNNNLQEALQGGQSYRKQISSAITSFLLEKIKNLELKTGVYNFDFKEVISGIADIPEEGKKILNNLKLAVIQTPILLAESSCQGALYLSSKASPQKEKFPNPVIHT